MIVTPLPLKQGLLEYNTHIKSIYDVAGQDFFRENSFGVMYIDFFCECADIRGIGKYLHYAVDLHKKICYNFYIPLLLYYIRRSYGEQ